MDLAGPTGAVVEIYLCHNQHLELLQAFENLEHIPYTILERLDYHAIAKQPQGQAKLRQLGYIYPDLQQTIVEAYIACDCLPEAKALIKAFKHEMEDYPAVLLEAYRAAFSHWTHAMNMDIIGLVSLCATDQEAAVHLILWYRQWESLAVAVVWHLILEEGSRAMVRQRYPAVELRIKPRAMAEAYWKASNVPWSERPCDLDVRGQHGPLGLPGEMMTLERAGIALRNIIIVNDISEFRECIGVLKNAKLAGLDAEWRTSLIANRASPAALLQVAVHHPVRNAVVVYMIDLHVLTGSDRPTAEWEEVMECLSNFISSDTTTKIGVNFEGDVSHLRLRVQRLLEIRGPNPRLLRCFHNAKVIDFKHIVRAKLLAEVENKKTECYARASAWATAHKRAVRKSFDWEGGLAEGVYILCGFHVSKEIQCSNWELRPLGNQQVAYAALDAGVLYFLTEKLIEETGSTLSESIQRCQAAQSEASALETSNKSRPPKPTLAEYCARFRADTLRLQQHWKTIAETENITEWRFLVPTDEVKLSQVLRGLGCDTERSQMSVKTLTKLAREADTKKRVLLVNVGKKSGHNGTCGGEIARLHYCFRANELDDRVREVIAVFSIALDPDRLCQRCSTCNSNRWIPGEAADQKLPETVAEIYKEFRQCAGCGLLYWEGLMWKNARQRFQLYFDNQFSFERKAAETPKEPQPPSDIQQQS